MAGVIQCRNFSIVLYPDSVDYQCEEVLSSLNSYFSEWAYILHDKDVDSDLQPLKPHYHVVGKKSSPVPFQTISNQLGVPLNHVEKCRRWNLGVRYLIHLDQSDKYQYDPSDIVSSFDVSPILDDAYEFNIVMKIIDYIEQNPNCTITELSKWCARNNCWSEFRRCFTIFLSIKNELKE